MNDYINKLIQQLRELQIQEAPAPWRLIDEYAIGGLTEVGYAEDSDYLLVVSSQGRGVFDCITGNILARNRESFDTNDDWYNETKLTAIGIGPLEGQLIRLAGLHGGGLCLTTKDGWFLELVSPDWPNTEAILQQAWKTIYEDIAYGRKVADSKGCEFRACGFSETGLSFIFATSCSLYIFSRQIATDIGKED